MTHQREIVQSETPQRPVRHRDWLWAMLAPLLVAIGLVGLHSVTVVFAMYHVGLCLVLPAWLARREGVSWREHTRRLGLVQGGVGVGLGLGVVMAAAPLLAYAVMPELFPDAARLRDVLHGWGVDLEMRGMQALGPLLLFMALVNGPAEELFWRGWLQERLVRGPTSALTLVKLFAVYHVLTIWKLAPEPGSAVVMLAGVVGAGGFWTWSREKWGSVWVAVLSHLGGTVGYMGVCWWVLR